MAELSPYAKLQFFDDNGDPLSGGKLYTYEAGTSTPKDSYSDQAGTVANTNPIVLDSGGRAVVFLEGSYKLVLKTSADVTVWTVDNVKGTISSGVADTIDDLKALQSGQSSIVFVTGYYAAGDGGQGTFYWNSTSTEADDGGVIIQPSSAPATGRWVRLLDGYISLKFYGAKGDGSTDDTTAIQSADTYADANGYTLSFIDGTYIIDNTTIEASWEFLKDAMISVNTAQTVTFNGKLQGDPIWQVFSGAGTVVFGAFAVVHARPEWWGAIADDSTDSTSAIEAAANSFNAGGVVQFARGTYRISFTDDAAHRITHTNTTYFPWQNGNLLSIIADEVDNLELRGDSKYSTIMKVVDVVNVAGTNYWMFGTYKSSGVKITGLHFDGNEDTVVRINGLFICGNEDYEGASETGLTVSDCKFNDIDICKIVLSTDDVNVSRNDYAEVKIAFDAHFINGCIFSDNIIDGAEEVIDFDKKVYYFTVANNTARNLIGGADAAFEFNASRFGVISGNTIDGGGSVDTGIYLNGKKQFGDQTVADADAQTIAIAITGNHITNCTRGIFTAAALLGGDPGFDYDTRDITISGNNIYDITRVTDDGYGIAVSGRNISITGNVLRKCDFAIGMNKSGRLQEFSIQSNTILDSNQTGIYIDSDVATPMLTGILSGNMISNSGVEGGAGCYGMLVEDAGNNVMYEGNVILETVCTTAMKLTYQEAGHTNVIVRNNVCTGDTNGFEFGSSLYDDIVMEGNIGVISGTSNTALVSRHQWYHSVLPASGTFFQGDFVIHTDPDNGEPYGWVYTSDRWLPAGYAGGESGISEALTIDAGAITVKQSSRFLRLETEGAAASDDLDTITMTDPYNGQMLRIKTTNNTRDVVFTESGNMVLNKTWHTLSLTKDYIELIYDTGLSKWVQYKDIDSTYVTDTTEATSAINASIGTAGGIYADKRVSSVGGFEGPHYGRWQILKGANIASASAITLGTDGNVFYITGTTTCNGITRTGWTNGSVVIFRFAGSLTWNHNTAAGGATDPLHLEGATAASFNAGDILVLYYDSDTSIWYEVSRHLQAGNNGFYGINAPATQPASANQAVITNSTGGAFDGTLATISGSGDDANINNNYTDLFTLQNEMRSVLINAGLMKGSA